MGASPRISLYFHLLTHKLNESTAFTWASGLPTHTQGLNQQRLSAGRKEEDTDERTFLKEDEKKDYILYKDYTETEIMRDGEKPVNRM